MIGVICVVEYKQKITWQIRDGIAVLLHHKQLIKNKFSTNVKKYFIALGHIESL